MKIVDCRQGCGQKITLKEDFDGKWKPYNVNQSQGGIVINEDGTLQKHNCPKSPYNLRNSGVAGVGQYNPQIQQKQQQQQQTQQPSDTSSFFWKQIGDRLTSLETKIDEIKLRIEMIDRRHDNLDQAIAPFLSTQGKIATELYQDKLQKGQAPETKNNKFEEVRHDKKADQYLNNMQREDPDAEIESMGDDTQ